MAVFTANVTPLQAANLNKFVASFDFDEQNLRLGAARIRCNQGSSSVSGVGFSASVGYSSGEYQITFSANSGVTPVVTLTVEENDSFFAVLADAGATGFNFKIYDETGAAVTSGTSYVHALVLAS